MKEASDYQRLASLLQDLGQPINRMETQLKSIQDSLDNGKRATILNWLSPTPYIMYHTQAQKDILSGTGEWFLNNERLLEWRKSSSSSIMWLHGPPGFGKSKLVSVSITSTCLQCNISMLTAHRSILIEKLLGEFQDGKNPNPVYFYFTGSPAEPERGEPKGVLRSIAKQMACLNLARQS